MPAVRRRRLPETRVAGKRLGRHIEHDPRSRGFPADRAPAVTSVRHEATGLPLDQGDTNACTANALCGALDTSPNLAGGRDPLGEQDALRLYTLETTLERRPYPAHDPGGSGLKVCRAAKQLGMISAYHHAFGLRHALEALVLRPVISGVTWYSSFDAPDPCTGVVELAAGASVRGGHEILAVEIDAGDELVWFWNSWGAAYGQGGRFAMTFDLWGRLLAAHGDVTVPIA